MTKFLLLVALVLCVAAGYIYATHSSSDLVIGALMTEGKNLQETIGENAKNARIEKFKEACLRETQNDGDVQRAGMDVAAYCGCVASAHVNIDMSVTDEEEKRREFYAQGKPCFEQYIKPPIVQICSQMNSAGKERMDCECLYDQTVREHVTMWIWGAEGKIANRLPQEREAMKAEFGKRLVEECGL